MFSATVGELQNQWLQKIDSGLIHVKSDAFLLPSLTPSLPPFFLDLLDLFERQNYKEKKRERDCVWAGLLPIWQQWSGLGLAKTRSQNPGLPCGWQSTRVKRNERMCLAPCLECSEYPIINDQLFYHAPWHNQDIHWTNSACFPGKLKKQMQLSCYLASKY